MTNIPIVLIDGNSLNLDRVEAIANNAKIVMPPSVQRRVEMSQNLVKQFAKGSTPSYGINTGVGFFANRRIRQPQLRKLQLNILKSHAVGFGPPLSIPETRLAMALRLNVLTKGYTGVSYRLCQALLALINEGIYPIIPEYGSVGASGDLAPLAHLALPLIGEGMVHYQGKTLPAREALKQAKLSPITLEEKEGLSLINGTQIMLAIGSLALIKAIRLIHQAEKITALTYEGLAASPDALNPMIHELRQQEGQRQVASEMMDEIKGSYLFDPATIHNRLQEPYSLRCAPQVHGPSWDAIQYVSRIVDLELNAVTDNPLVFAEQHKILSGGNFHGQALAMAFDIGSIAIAELANISDRRLELLLNPHMSGLPAFLTPRAGINSGYMATQYLSASLVNDNKGLANPACTDSIPGNVGIEDFVSMGMTSARKFKGIVRNTTAVLAIEMLAATQAIDLRKVKKLGQGTRKTYTIVRSLIPKLVDDRLISEDIAKAVDILEKGLI
jgi:histidine ammonia-lyase